MPDLPKAPETAPKAVPTIPAPELPKSSLPDAPRFSAPSQPPLQPPPSPPMSIPQVIDGLLRQLALLVMTFRGFRDAARPSSKSLAAGRGVLVEQSRGMRPNLCRTAQHRLECCQVPKTESPTLPVPAPAAPNAASVTDFSSFGDIFKEVHHHERKALPSAISCCVAEACGLQAHALTTRTHVAFGPLNIRSEFLMRRHRRRSSPNQHPRCSN